MSGTKISAATDIASVQATDMVPLARSGSSAAYKATAAELTAFSKAGRTDGSTPAAGQIGEYLSAVNTTPVTLSTGVAANAVSLALTAGDWDVQGEAWITLGSGGSQVIAAAITTTSASIPTAPSVAHANHQLNVSSGSQEFMGQIVLPLAPARINVASATTVFLCVQCTLTSGTTTAIGMLGARRVS